MLTSTTMVQISADGTSVPAKDLRIGHTVFDVSAQCHREVSYILKRTLDVRQLPALAPCVIRWAACADGLPRTDVHLSPKQMLLAAKKSRANGPKYLTYRASELADTCSTDFRTEDTRVTYVTPIFEQPSFVVCSGLLTYGYTAENLGHSLASLKENLSR